MRELRSPKPAIDASKPLAVEVERERVQGGETANSVTIFLAGRECPFTCIFCDLWRHTLDEPTPAGAIPGQIRLGLEEVGRLEPGTRLKLYNASNFFDDKAVPRADDDEIVELCAEAHTVVVECHPKLVGERCFEFGERLAGRLEVAMGLETVHPEVLPRLNKKMTVEEFDDAARELRAREIGVRAFVLVGVPFLGAGEQVDWTVRSVEHAIAVGAGVVSIIPMRGGNGEMERLAAAGEFEAPTLDQLEEAFDRALELADEGVVQVDVWDLEQMSGCLRCTSRRHERLRRLNLSGEPESRISCPICAGVR